MLKNAIVNILDLTGGLAFARLVTRRKPSILMYHRVTDNPLLPGISPTLFEAQIVYVKERFNVVSLNDLLIGLQGKSEPYQLAITFDDGHRDFYTTAWPILRKHKIPATLFVTTGFLDKKIWLWPDLLRTIVVAAKPDSYFIKELGVIAINTATAISVWNRIADYCLTLKHDQRIHFILELAAILGIQVNPEPQEPFAPVSWHELREMHSEGLDIGSHSVTHPILSDLNDEELSNELKYSKERITEEIGIEPKGICYPNGMARDTSDRVERKARLLYQYGLVAYPAEVSKENAMHLGRIAASSNLPRFKLLINGISPHINRAGEYK